MKHAMDKAGGVPPAKPRRGRPRKNNSEKSVRRLEIMDAAIRLFSESSYRETTMSDIARSLGLNQSSLYYWFKDKEDLLEAILEENQTSLRLAALVSDLPGDNSLHLYAVVYSDTLMMCGSPFDYFELEEAALAHPDRFRSFFDTYRTLNQTIERIIERGIEEGDFSNRTNPALATSIVLSLTEGLQHQYHQAVSDASVDGAAWDGLAALSSHEVAHLAAKNALLALGDSNDIDALHAEAQSRGWLESASKDRSGEYVRSNVR